MAEERLLEGVDIFANATFPQMAPILMGGAYQGHYNFLMHSLSQLRMMLPSFAL